MRIASLALIFGFTSLAGAAELRPFAITCNQLVVGPAKTVNSSLRIDWDGSILTSTEQNFDNQLDRHVEKSLGGRLLASDSGDDVRISIFTSTHAEKMYSYYTAFHFLPKEALIYSRIVIPAEAGIQRNQQPGPRLSPG